MTVPWFALLLARPTGAKLEFLLRFTAVATAVIAPACSRPRGANAAPAMPALDTRANSPSNTVRSGADFILSPQAQAMLAGYAGLLLSYHLDTPSGATIIGCAGVLYALSLLISPCGWLPRQLVRTHREA